MKFLERMALLASLVLFWGCQAEKENLMATEEKPVEKLKVMQLNTWGEGRSVPGGKDAIVAVAGRYCPDVLFFCEILDAPAFHDWFIGRMQKDYGIQYYGTTEKCGTMVFSRKPVVKTGVLDHGVYAELNDGGRRILVCSMHLNYKEYACYLPRGCHGNTWQKMPAPVVDVKQITEMNLRSKRQQSIAKAVAFADEYQKRGDLVILGGDFNEPSHLDWTARTAELYDHHGVAMDWHSTRTLEQAGFQDAYREIHPDELKYPGLTFPVNNHEAPLKILTWAPWADERDRIDFIFYNRNAGVRLVQAGLMGPDTTIVQGKRDDTPQRGAWIRIPEHWPSDHAGNFAEFELR